MARPERTGGPGPPEPGRAQLTPTVACLDPAGRLRAGPARLREGDTYQVRLIYPFRLLTPILGSIIGNVNLGRRLARVVLNLAFDPTPGASIQKFVSPTARSTAPDVIAKCLEPDDTDAAGYYRSPCRDCSTPDPTTT